MEKKSFRDDISDTQRKMEVAAVLLTGTGKFIFMDLLQWKLPFILVAIFLWVAYIVSQNQTRPGILYYWGFRTDNFRKAVTLILPYGITSIVLFFTVGYYRETLNITWYILPVLILYPIWGTIQQFLVIALVGGNLHAMNKGKGRSAIIIFLTAILFGLLHYPHYWLVFGTFVLALLYGFIYLKSRNLYAMGLFHGWLGALFFYTVVGRDPLAEVFGKLFH